MKILFCMLMALALAGCSSDSSSGANVYDGFYSGTYIGDDQGEWSITILNGVISGSGVSNFNNNTVLLTGTAKKGNISCEGISGGYKTTFTGVIKADSISGTWKTIGAGETTSGTFSGQKQ